MFLFISHALIAQEVVHDFISYAHDTIKAAQDEIYQQLDLDFQMKKLGVAGENLKQCIESVNIAKDTFQTLNEVYSTAVDINDRIGDPTSLVSYMNSRFWHEHEIDAGMSILRTATNSSDNDVTSLSTINSLLSDVEYAVRDVELQKARRLAKSQKIYYGTREAIRSAPKNAYDQLSKLNQQDKAFDPKSATVYDMLHADYKTNLWQANMLGQMASVNAMHASAQMDQFYKDGVRENEENLARAKNISIRNIGYKEAIRNRKENLLPSQMFDDEVIKKLGDN